MIHYRCSTCGTEMQSPDSLAGQGETCPACGKPNIVPARSRRQAADRDAGWRRMRRQENRENMRDDLRDNRECERDLKRLGGFHAGRELAGWLIRVGPNCPEVGELDGCLVTVQDAARDPGLLPPYDSCRAATCECDIDPVAREDVPPGTRIIERANINGQAHVISGAAPSRLPEKVEMFADKMQNFGSALMRIGCGLLALGVLVPLLLLLAAGLLSSC